MSETAIGIDVGATNTKIVHVDRTGRILADMHFPTDADWPARIPLEAARFADACAAGVAAPGIASPDGETIWWMFGKMAGLVDFDWPRAMSRPRVPVLNDAQAALLGEAWLGAARGTHNAIMLTLGTGVGGAIMSDGRLLRGHLGRAGHLGHITIDATGKNDIVNTPGSLEDSIGEYTMGQRTGRRFTSTRQLLEARRNGDGEAERLWLSSIRALAAALASLINAVDPEIAIIGGGVASAGDELFVPLRAMMDKFEWRPHGRRVKIVPAELGDRAGALGAAWNALKEAGVFHDAG
jgi:glucokinase